MDQPFSGSLSFWETDSIQLKRIVVAQTTRKKSSFEASVQNGQGHLHSMEEQVTVARGAERILPAALVRRPRHALSCLRHGKHHYSPI